MDVAVWDSTSAFHDGASGRWLPHIYIRCLDLHQPTCHRGQDNARCYGRRMGELGGEGEISIASWGLLITYIPNAVFAFRTVLC